MVPFWGSLYIRIIGFRAYVLALFADAQNLHPSPGRETAILKHISSTQEPCDCIVVSYEDLPQHSLSWGFLYWGYVGLMEKKMETTIGHWGYPTPQTLDAKP